MVWIIFFPNKKNKLNLFVCMSVIFLACLALSSYLLTQGKGLLEDFVLHVKLVDKTNKTEKQKKTGIKIHGRLAWYVSWRIGFTCLDSAHISCFC